MHIGNNTHTAVLFVDLLNFIHGAVAVMESWPMTVITLQERPITNSITWRADTILCKRLRIADNIHERDRSMRIQLRIPPFGRNTGAYSRDAISSGRIGRDGLGFRARLTAAPGHT